MPANKPIAFKLVPVYEPEPGAIVTNQVMTCALSGRILGGHNGAGLYLAPEIVDEIRLGHVRYERDPD